MSVGPSAACARALPRRPDPPDVIRSRVREVGADFFYSHPAGEILQHRGDRAAPAAETWLATSRAGLHGDQLLGVHRDPHQMPITSRPFPASAKRIRRRTPGLSRARLAASAPGRWFGAHQPKCAHTNVTHCVCTICGTETPCFASQIIDTNSLFLKLRLGWTRFAVILVHTSTRK